MKNHHHHHPIHPKSPAHEDIAERAYALWNEQGQPENCHEANWLEAEQQVSRRQPEPTAAADSTPPLLPAREAGRPKRSRGN